MTLARPGQPSARAQPADAGNAADIEKTGRAASNVDIVRRHHAVLNTGDVVAAARFFSVDTRNHGIPVGRNGVLRVLTDIFTTFPDWRMEFEQIAAIDDDVIARMIVRTRIDQCRRYRSARLGKSLKRLNSQIFINL